MNASPPVTIEQLVGRAGALAGVSVEELAAGLGVELPADTRRAKGLVGSLVERVLGADAGVRDEPDFRTLGVELKTVPVGPRGVPAESTFCCSIHMASADTERWETSRLRRRLARVLWVPVQSARVARLAQRRFGRAVLWEPTAVQWATLRADWEDLMGAIGAGWSEELCGHIGAVLQVRPKAPNAQARVWAPGPDGPHRVPPLGFYLRASFTAGLLGLSSTGWGGVDPGVTATCTHRLP